MNAYVETRAGSSRTVKNLKCIKILNSDSESVVTEFNSFAIGVERYAFVGDNILVISGSDILFIDFF